MLPWRKLRRQATPAPRVGCTAMMIGCAKTRSPAHGASGTMGRRWALRASCSVMSRPALSRTARDQRRRRRGLNRRTPDRCPPRRRPRLSLLYAPRAPNLYHPRRRCPRRVDRVRATRHFRIRRSPGRIQRLLIFCRRIYRARLLTDRRRTHLLRRRRRNRRHRRSQSRGVRERGMREQRTRQGCRHRPRPDRHQIRPRPVRVMVRRRNRHRRLPMDTRQLRATPPLRMARIAMQ
jgi:hypothetical protein